MSFSLLLADHRFDLDNLGGMSLDRISHHGFCREMGVSDAKS